MTCWVVRLGAAVLLRSLITKVHCAVAKFLFFQTTTFYRHTGRNLSIQCIFIDNETGARLKRYRHAERGDFIGDLLIFIRERRMAEKFTLYWLIHRNKVLLGSIFVYFLRGRHAKRKYKS